MQPTPLTRYLPAAALLGAMALATHSVARAGATIGQPAPAFSATDTAGKTVKLADFKGKTVVLEWTNPGCPFVRKHYDSGNMQDSQKAATDQQVVWLAVNSTHPDSGDHKTPAAMAQWMTEQKAHVTATLIDPEGVLGRAYGARTTPQMFIVNAAGTLVYAGAIDSKATARTTDIATATNHVNAALAELAQGKPVSVPLTQPYGCSVKYKVP
jgi:peroxiredoxin